MDLVGIDPQLNLYDESWPIRTQLKNLPPPKFVFGSRGDSDRCGLALDSIVCAGTIVSGGRVERSILGPSVRVNSFAQVFDSILFEGVEVGRRTKIRNAIIDKGVCIPAGFEIGFDLELDQRRGFTISNNGIVTVAKTEDLSTLAMQSNSSPHRADKGTSNITPPNGISGLGVNPQFSRVAKSAREDAKE